MASRSTTTTELKKATPNGAKLLTEADGCQ